MSSTAVQLVFAGEILPGFSQAQVREKLGRRLRLDEPRLNKLFSGQRVVIKRDLSPLEAADWVQRFRAIGAVLHAVPAKTPAVALPPPVAPKALVPPPPPPAKAPPPPAPVPARRAATPPPDSSMMLSLVPDSEMPAPPPPPRPMAAPARTATAAPAAASSGPEEVTCPNCGERQSKRVICRSCLCDMPRTLASQKAEAEARRQARLEEQRARNEQRLAQEQQQEDDFEDELPPLLSLSLEGRMGRMRYLGSNALGLACGLGLWIGLMAVAISLSKAALLWGGGLITLLLVLWSIRLTVLRLHDLNRSGWWALLQLVPGLNAVFSLVLVFWPGSPDENDYGPALDDAQWLLALFGVVVFGATALVTSPQFWVMLAR